MMNIYLHELRSNLKSLLIWSVLVILLIWIGIIKFAAYADNPEMLAILDTMPRQLIDAFNMRAFNLTTLIGFFGLMFSYFALMVAVAAGLWGSGVLAREERDKTIEFALSLPISRNRLVTAKALAALTLVILFVLIIWATSLIAMRPYAPDAATHRFLAREMLSLLGIGFIFWGAGLLLAAVLPRPKRAGLIVVAVVFTTYYLSVITGLHEKLDFLKYLTPFKYFDVVKYLQDGIEPVYWGLTAAIILASLAGAYLAYNRRDITI